jgi:hypothetical protein
MSCTLLGKILEHRYLKSKELIKHLPELDIVKEFDLLQYLAQARVKIYVT